MTAPIQETGRHVHVVVSPEMTILIGRGPFEPVAVPEDAIALVFAFGALNAPPALSICGVGAASEVLARAEAATRALLLIAPVVVDRIAGRTCPAAGERLHFHLPTELRAIALALRDCARTGEAGDIYRAAKGIELLYETWALLDAGAMAPLSLDGTLSREDTLRILAARRLIDERWNEKLSLDGIAQKCGLNREKLTRGFRETFGMTVAEAIAEQRLQNASRMLLTTDLPVSLVGYENGYLNNASFARAFGRRFGASPSDFRSRQLAA